MAKSELGRSLRLTVGAGAMLAVLATGAAYAQDAGEAPAATPSPSVVTLPAPVEPSAADYAWSAEKTADSLLLQGMVPGLDVEQALMAQAGAGAADGMQIADGAPEGFASAAAAGLAALMGLETGTLQLASGHWSLSGEAATAEAADSVRSGLEKAVDATGWTIDISSPEAAAVPPPMAESAPAPATSPAAPSSSETDQGSAATSDETAPTESPAAEPEAAEATEPPPPLAVPEPPAAGSTPAAQGEDVPRENAAPAVPAQPEAAPAEAAPVPSDAEAPPPAPPQAETEPAEPAEAAPEPPAASPPATPVAPAKSYHFSATREGGGPIALSGDVPADAAKRYFSVMAGKAETSGLTVTPGAPEGFTIAATTGLRVLRGLEHGALGYEDGTWSLSGKAATTSALASAKAAIAGLPDAARWRLELEGPSPLEICRAAVADAASANAITFAPGSARVAPASTDTIARIAADLKACPDTRVEVEGHTDSDGDADANLALSVARAEAVVAALADQGVDSDRLYAVGYGESRPLVANDTPADKARNRRIGFTVLPR